MRLLAFFLIITLPLQTIAQEVGRNEKSFMGQIVLHCSETPVLYKEDYVIQESDVQAFQDTVRWVTRDVEALLKTMPEADKSEYKIKGKSFKEHISHCLDVFNKNQAALERRTSSQPNKDATAKLESALFSCKVILRNKGAAEFPGFYSDYIKNRDEAFALDGRVKQWRQEEREVCDQQVLVLKQEHDKEQAAMIAKARKEEEVRKAKALTEEKERQHQAAERQKREEMVLEEKSRKAKALGFDSYQAGLLGVTERLESGKLSLVEAESYLIETTPRDKFKVQSVVDDYVIYAYTKDSFDIVQVAIPKKSGRYYGDGAGISQGFYHIKDTEEFATIFGGKRQVLVLGEVEE